jgi:hypothetical protein
VREPRIAAWTKPKKVKKSENENENEGRREEGKKDRRQVVRESAGKNLNP